MGDVSTPLNSDGTIRARVVGEYIPSATAGSSA
jgi:outer membrane receptor for ferric coprogen and ferric-rhodotorulic acid